MADGLERKYDALEEKINENKKRNGEVVSVAAASNVPANSSDGKGSKGDIGKNVSVKQKRATAGHVNNTDDEERTPQYLKVECQVMKQVLSDLIMNAKKGIITKGNLWSAITGVIDSSNVNTVHNV